MRAWRAAIFPASIATSLTPSSPSAGSTTFPPAIKRSYTASPPFWAVGANDIRERQQRALLRGSSSGVALAMIGCGGMGVRRLEGHAALKRAGIDLCDLVAVCDLDEVNAAAAARRAGELLGRMPAVYGDLETLVSESKPDALDIVTTVSSHHVVAVRAMELGLHLMVEKPLAITTKAASLIEKAAKRTGRI